MNQRVLNSGQFRGAAAVNASVAVPYLDATPAPNKKNVSSRKPLWPIAVLAIGGTLTLLWDGFLLWQVIRLLVFWLGPDI